MKLIRRRHLQSNKFYPYTMKLSQIFLSSIISSISCAPVNLGSFFVNGVDNVAAASATAAVRRPLTRGQSAPSRIGEGMVDSIPIKVVPDDGAAELAANTRKDKITAGLLAGGVGGFVGGLTGSAVSG
jgi:hypothetical protein